MTARLQDQRVNWRYGRVLPFPAWRRHPTYAPRFAWSPTELYLTSREVGFTVAMHQVALPCLLLPYSHHVEARGGVTNDLRYDASTRAEGADPNRLTTVGEYTCRYVPPRFASSTSRFALTIAFVTRRVNVAGGVPIGLSLKRSPPYRPFSLSTSLQQRSTSRSTCSLRVKTTQVGSRRRGYWMNRHLLEYTARAWTHEFLRWHN